MAAEERKAADSQQLENEYEGKLAASKAIRKLWEKEIAKALKAGEELPTMPAEAIEPKRPIRPRSWVVNVTTEKLARIMSEEPGWCSRLDRRARRAHWRIRPVRRWRDGSGLLARMLRRAYIPARSGE
jgi:hypothetical protein